MQASLGLTLKHWKPRVGKHEVLAKFLRPQDWKAWNRKVVELQIIHLCPEGRRWNPKFTGKMWIARGSCKLNPRITYQLAFMGALLASPANHTLHSTLELFTHSLALERKPQYQRMGIEGSMQRRACNLQLRHLLVIHLLWSNQRRKLGAQGSHARRNSCNIDAASREHSSRNERGQHRAPTKWLDFTLPQNPPRSLYRMGMNG